MRNSSSSNSLTAVASVGTRRDDVFPSWNTIFKATALFLLIFELRLGFLPFQSLSVTNYMGEVPCGALSPMTSGPTEKARMMSEFVNTTKDQMRRVGRIENGYKKREKEFHEREQEYQQKEAAFTFAQKTYNEQHSRFKQMESEFAQKDAEIVKKQEKIDKLTADLVKAQQALQKKTGAKAASAENIEEKINNDVTARVLPFQNKCAICRLLGNKATGTDNTGIAPTAANIWSKNLQSILKASQHPMDTTFEKETSLHNMLLDLPPSMLQKGLKVRPKPEEITRILKIVERRRKNPSFAPPLKVLVMGGSVTEGVGCNQPGIEGRNCNWSVRLESFLNNILGFDAVKLINIASGGTNSEQAIQILKYWMYPDDVLPAGPDVIIHAYSANDSNLGHFKNNTDAMGRISTLFRLGIERVNSFVKIVHTTHKCPPPIIFHLDDYVGGHSQGGILQDMVYNMVMTKVAGWYDNFAVSSADVVRMLTYANTTGEAVFSPHWRTSRGRDQYDENCHFAWQGHQMITWVWAYSFLDSLVNYCDLQDSQLKYQSREQQLGTERNSRITANAREFVTSSLNEINKYNTQVVPPPLLPEMRLEKVSEAWTEEATKQSEYCKNTDSAIPCDFKWTTGPVGRTSNIVALQNYLKPFIEEDKSKNWRTEVDNEHGWSRKLGVVMDNGAVLQFKVPKLSASAKLLTIQSLKSYGEKWDSSKVQVQVLISKNEHDHKNKKANNKQVLKASIEGNHTSHTSVQYSTELQLLEPVPEGSDAIVKLTLVGGSTFKIMGMMLCSR